MSAILIIARQTKPVFKLEREFDGSNPKMKFERNLIKNDEVREKVLSTYSSTFTKCVLSTYSSTFKTVSTQYLLKYFFLVLASSLVLSGKIPYCAKLCTAHYHL